MKRIHWLKAMRPRCYWPQGHSRVRIHACAEAITNCNCWYVVSGAHTVRNRPTIVCLWFVLQEDYRHKNPRFGCSICWTDYIYAIFLCRIHFDQTKTPFSILAFTGPLSLIRQNYTERILPHCKKYPFIRQFANRFRHPPKQLWSQPIDLLYSGTP